jgi:hypothetical protein
MSSKNDLISDHVQKFLTKLHTKTNQDKLFIGVCTIELLRRAQQIDRAAVNAIVSFLSRVNDVPWGDIPFSVTQTVLIRGKEVAKEYGAADEHVPDVLLSALVNFSDLVDGYLLKDPELTPAELFDAVVAEETEKFLQRAAQVKDAPGIYDHTMLRKCFKPATTSDGLLQELGAGLITYRGDSGVTLRGLAFDGVSGDWRILLETGELVSIPKDDPGLKTAASPNDYANICPALLVAATACGKMLGAAAIASDAATAKIVAGVFGEFVKPFVVVDADRNAISVLEQVLHPDGHGGVTGPTGAAVHFPIDINGQKAYIALNAVPSKDGPYVTAKLVVVSPGRTPTESVLMHLDHPRYLSARGVYLFPLEEEVICLRIMV